jgi:hypothetical protein
VWAIDAGGATAFKGGRNPVPAISLTWSNIHSVTRMESKVGQRFLPTIAFATPSRGGQIRELPFAVRGTVTRFFPLTAAKVDAIYEQILARAPSSWSLDPVPV